jgi:hypothetical protein
MCRFTVIGLVCGILIVAEAAEAQIVRWGPGGGVSVRAPFVHVEVGPGGSTYVRAPFTSVNTPGFGRPAFRYDDPSPYRSGPVTSGQTSGNSTTRLRPLTAEEYSQSPASTPHLAITDPAQMNWRELRRHTRAVASSLENELTRVADGSAWAGSLRPGTIRDLLAEDADQPPDPTSVDQLLDILRSYDALVESNGYPQIARLTAFREMRQALGELVLPPLGRARRNLADQWAMLYDELNQFATGATWQAYLDLSPALRDSPADAQATLRYLEELVERYNQAIGPEEYRPVSQLPSFRSTRQALVNYLELLKVNASSPDSAASQPEVIPPPQPLR